MIRYFVLALAVSPLAVSPACPPPTGAFATFSPTSLSFAPQVVSPGDSPSASQMVTLKATGARNLSIANIEASGASHKPITARPRFLQVGRVRYKLVLLRTRSGTSAVRLLFPPTRLAVHTS